MAEPSLHIAQNQWVGESVSAIGSQYHTEITVLLTCRLVQIYEEGHSQGIKQWATASGIIDLLLNTCYWEWKLESGEGTTIPWGAGQHVLAA